MSPPGISSQPTFEIPKPDFPSTQSSKSSESFNFSAGSTYTAGFNYSRTGPEKSQFSSRSRPRLVKVRRRQMPVSQDRETVKSDLGLNGFSDGSGEKEVDGKLGNVFGVNDRNSVSNGSARGRDSNGNTEQLGSGLVFGVSSNDSLFGSGSGNGKSFFGSSMNSSTNKSQSQVGDFSFTFDKGSSNFDVQKDSRSFVLGASKAGSTANQNLPGYGSNKNGLQTDANSERRQFVHGVGDRGFSWKSNLSEKDVGGNFGQSKVHESQKSDCFQFLFGSSNHDSASQVKLDRQDSNKSSLHLGVDDFVKSHSANFVFSAMKNASSMTNPDTQKQDSGGSTDNTGPDKVAGNTIPDVRGKVKLDTSGDSEKVCNPCFQFSFNQSGISGKNHLNFVFGSDNGDSRFGIDLENKSTDKNKDMPDFTHSGKENAEIGFQSQNACLNGAFIFGGLKGKGGYNSGGNAEPFSKMGQSNGGKVDDCRGFGHHNHNSFSDINFKFRGSGGSGDSFEKGAAFSVSDEMKRLNISDSEVDAKKSGDFTGNFAVNANHVFVFGGHQKNSGTVKENHSSVSQKSPDVNHFSCNNSESNRTSSILFPSGGIGAELNGGFGGPPSESRVETDSISFRGKLAGLDSSDAGYSTSNMKFDFSSENLFPGIDKLDSANHRSRGGKRSKKKNGKLRQRTVVQQLFSQNHEYKEGNSDQSQNSAGCGSPMDFSPYRDTSAGNPPEADTGTGVKGEFPRNENHTSEHCGKRHDDRSTSNFPPPLPSQDGLPAIRHQNKKKYKLRVGSNPTSQRNDPDKENAKQEPSGTAFHEVCEHWRIRGNEAYHAGQLSKAEEFYSIGINSVPNISTIGLSMKPLLLCYSNRAATRMSLGRMREAIGDCTKASELDSDFLKVTLRAGNCYLVLGEVEDAIQCYTKCLSAGTGICLDRRATIEAADGLQKAKKVAEHILQSAKVLEEGTDDAASSTLGIIEEALSISRYSDRLFEMKGQALYMLRMYDEVIQLCERTLDIAEKNFSSPECKSSHVKLWRWHLQSKTHYRLGRLDLALDLIEKQEKMPISPKSGDAAQESSVALAANIRDLLSLKKSGNEAFNSRRYTEAIENYTAAISKSFESRGFMAICFCNRAAAYQSLSQIVDAISDCSVAIALDENYPKAISRRATLHEMIRDYKQAACDLQRMVSLLESQSQIKTQGRSSGGSVRDLRKARRRLSSVEEKAKKEIPLDLYLILGIKAPDAETEIKKAYRKAALRHHPDKAGQVLSRNDVGDDGTLWKEFGEKIHKDADRLFKIIGEAYAVLSDTSKRAKYDNEEEIRNIYRDSNGNSNSGHPSTSYSSPYERGSCSGRQGFGTPFERSSSRRYWHDARSYSKW